MNKPLRLLIVEDSENDTLIVVEYLRLRGYKVVFERVETEEAMKAALNRKKWDIIISDYSLPSFSAPRALKVFQGKNIDIPFIVVSGTIEEGIAVEMMRDGAYDYLMKDDLSRLCVAIDKEMNEVVERRFRKEAEQKFRVIFDNARDGMIIGEIKERKLLFGNRMVYDMLGYTPQEFICLKIEDIHPKDDLPYVMEQFKKQVRGEIALAVDIPVKRKNGSIFYADVNSSLVVLDNKKCLIGVFRDITNQKELKQKLLQDETKYRGLFENMSSGVAVCKEINDGNDFVIVSFNRAAEKIDKIKRIDVINKSILDVFPGVKEFGLFDVFQRVLKTGKSESYPAALYKDSRQVAWRENYVYKLPSGEIVTVYNDITERKEMERVKEKLLCDIRKRMKELKCLYEITRILEKYNIYQEDILQEIVLMIADAWQYSEITCARIVFEEKEYMTINFKITSWRQSSVIRTRKKKYGIVEVFYLEERPNEYEGPFLKEERDLIEAISERLGGSFESRMNEAQLFQSEKLTGIGQMAVGLVHELASPLMGILNLLEFYESKSENDVQQKNDLHKMISAAKYMKNILVNLNMFVKKVEPKMEQVNFNDVIDNTLVFSEFNLKKNNIVVEKRYSSDLCWIKGNNNQLQQIVLNMLNNSVDAMPNGGIFTISTENSENKESIIIKFCDTGMGIKKENLSKVFYPFFTTKGIGIGTGTGLGLSVIHGIVKSHGGDILVRSEEGKGTVFILTFITIKMEDKNE
ncbi:MAG: PAS domain S-box protein [Candidatus Omnitrophica bacterium]|nr:PAS domain S-box protein [Candidatus Omnitrophota bacterium]